MLLWKPRRTGRIDGESLAGQSTAASVGSEWAKDGIAVGYDLLSFLMRATLVVVHDVS
jgi:hypothetical protein